MRNWEDSYFVEYLVDGNLEAVGSGEMRSN